MTDAPISEADMAAYKAAQKTRNLYIGGALLVFVILVFALSIARLSEGMKHYKANHLTMSNVPAAAGASAS
jgi:hypothetical protein